MKVTQHIEEAKGKTLFSFEIIPPQKGKGIQELYDNIDPLMEFDPPFIDVTTSREEFIYVDKGNGLLDKKLNTMLIPFLTYFVADLQRKKQSIY
jgi:methylenetetrahydrofolate reductase (NADPH)